MRTIIVGDVHGCRAELESLLDRIGFATGDRLIFVGDLVARGPDSLGVLDVVRRTGAILVRGNHEQKLLTLRHLTTEKRDLHTELAKRLRPIDWTLLETAPTFVDLPEHGARVVHAGVNPYLAFSAHAPETLMRIRTVKAKKRGHVLWGEVYEGPPHVVFGHNAAPGLQLHRWATGLDTGCVYGGKLTAMVLAENAKIPAAIPARRALLVSEPARRVSVFPGRRGGERDRRDLGWPAVPAENRRDERREALPLPPSRRRSGGRRRKFRAALRARRGGRRGT